MAAGGIEIAVGISVRPCGKLEVSKPPIVRKEAPSVGDMKLIDDRHAGAIQCRIAKLSCNVCGTGTKEHHIINLERCSFGVKYES
jgi:hypothetical protein